MRCGGGLLLAALLLAGLGAADVVFRVPEVLVRHAAAARPVGSGRPAARPDRAPQRYYVEHAISAADAKRAADELRPADLEEGAPPGCGRCSRRELAYCEGRALEDHCCCERRFSREPFPWLPHTCYLGPERCSPAAGDCAAYARLRDCCCVRRLARHWRCVLSATGRAGVRRDLPLLAALLLLAARR